jgi:muramoyltetrapeptide carboxypeptidase
MLHPAYLKEGDTVGIVAPARKIKAEDIEVALKVFQSWGLEVVLGGHLFHEWDQFSGTDEQRADDLQQMLNNKEIKAIFCARGGYGTVRIVDKLDLTFFKIHPKWIVGYSDITVLHTEIHKKLGIESIHAVMPINFPSYEPLHPTIKSLQQALFGHQLIYSFQHKLSKLNRDGEGYGEVVGGNLSILYCLQGSSSSFATHGKILFLEDLDEYLYHIDRMLVNLKRSGMLDHLEGLIVGGMTDMKDNPIPFGKTAVEIILDAVKEYDFPVLFDFPAGHTKNNLALLLGRKARLSVSAVKAELVFD